ncbi:MAG TPA: hypothetical protein DEQ68_03975 [Ruminococcaceae bacterium]|nr:hypothetical protein [Oscillospiraceae bacterium]
MIDFILINEANIIVGAILAAAIVFAVIRIIRNKRSGRSCGGNCSDCKNCDLCSSKNKRK